MDIIGDGRVGPAVVHANHYQFGEKEVVGPRVVASRFMLWGISGHGCVKTGGRAYELLPGTLLVLPWMHDVRYQAADVDPFWVGAVHIVPWHDVGPIEPRAGHDPYDPLTHTRLRSDMPWPGFDETRVITGTQVERLVALGERVVESWTESPVSEALMRSWGVVLVDALTSRRPDQPSAIVPRSLRLMQEFALNNLGSQLDAKALAEVAGCSISTVERQFRRFTGRSPQRWIREARITHAARLLATTNLRVGEVARRVGFEDPLYFSRVFRAERRFSPSQARVRLPLLEPPPNPGAS